VLPETGVRRFREGQSVRRAAVARFIFCNPPLRGGGHSFSVGGMKLVVWLARAALAVLVCASANGCLPTGSGQLEEEKESHFLAGRSCLNSMDYKGAVEAFEKALEVNPRSASAHFELACLFDQKESDPSAAVYHYKKFLKLRPDYENAETIKQRINTCEQDLARTVLPLPVAPGMQHQFEQLAEENKQLRQELEQWKAYYNRATAPTNALGLPPVRPAQSFGQTQLSSTGLVLTVSNSGPRPPATVGRTHTVQSGDTFSSIARKYGVKLDTLMSANPGLQPTRLRVGQTLNIPAS
jgi:LysM repeat protein